MTKCPTGKRRYSNAQHADTVLARIWRTVKPGRQLESRYYLCPFCGGYHLTSKPLRHGTEAS